MDVFAAPSDERLDAYTELAASTLDTPIASVIRIEGHRTLVKAVQGCTDADACLCRVANSVSKIRRMPRLVRQSMIVSIATCVIWLSY